MDELGASRPVNCQVMSDAKDPGPQAIVRDSLATGPVEIKPQKRLLRQVLGLGGVAECCSQILADRGSKCSIDTDYVLLQVHWFLGQEQDGGLCRDGRLCGDFSLHSHIRRKLNNTSQSALSLFRGSV